MTMRMKIVAFLAVVTTVAAGPLIEKHPQRDMVLRSLQRLVDEAAKKPENHFFFLRRADGCDWVYWREGRLLWATDMEPHYEKKGLTEQRARSIWDLRLRTPRKPIDLDSGVVPKQADVGSSTYLVSKDFVAEIVFDCVQDGDLVVVRKRPNK
jgi:hypothetical protein